MPPWMWLGAWACHVCVAAGRRPHPRARAPNCAFWGHSNEQQKSRRGDGKRRAARAKGGSGRNRGAGARTRKQHPAPSMLPHLLQRCLGIRCTPLCRRGALFSLRVRHLHARTHRKQGYLRARPSERSHLHTYLTQKYPCLAHASYMLAYINTWRGFSPLAPHMT